MTTPTKPIIHETTAYRPCYCLSCQNQWFIPSDVVMEGVKAVCPRCEATDTFIGKGVDKK